MELKLNIGYEQLMQLINQLSHAEKERILNSLQKMQNKAEEHPTGVRVPGKFKGKIVMSENFNEPLEDLKEYM